MKPSAPHALFFVLSGPCGTGKTSLALSWLQRDSKLSYTRSVTTRQPRDPSKAEEQYEYVSRDEFLRMVSEDAFAQWINPSYDEYYGTRRAPLEVAIHEGRDLVFDYCPEGYLNLRRLFPDQVIGIFLMAPDLDVLRARLLKRGTEDIAEMRFRYQMALQDFNFVDAHDYHIINDDFEATLAKLQAIRVAEKCRLSRQPGLVEAYAAQARPALLRYYDPPARS